MNAFEGQISLGSQLERTYATIAENTTAAWRSEPRVGSSQLLPYDEKLLAFTTGQWFQPTDGLLRLHEELLELGRNDSRLRVIARENTHFTFLALSPHRYTGPNDYPEEHGLLKGFYAQYVEPARFELSSLRLVPLAHTLLLAGIPNDETFAARGRFAAAVLASAWGDLLRARYEPHPVPPVIWHTTLARSTCRFLPPAVRELFYRHREERFPSIDLGQPILAAVSYDWSTVKQILP